MFSVLLRALSDLMQMLFFQLMQKCFKILPDLYTFFFPHVPAGRKNGNGKEDLQKDKYGYPPYMTDCRYADKQGKKPYSVHHIFTGAVRSDTYMQNCFFFPAVFFTPDEKISP